jgi:Ca2+-binding RTX toxin-like protein
VSVLTLLTWLVIVAMPATAATTCSAPVDVDPGAPVVDQVTATIAPDDSVAFRFAAGAIEKIDNPPASLLGAVWGACAGAGTVDVFRIVGTDLGHETVRLVNGGDGADQDGWGVNGVLTFVDLNANPASQPDITQFETLAGAYLGVEFGTSTSGTTVADPDWAIEGIGADDADVQIVDTETLGALGDQAPTGVTDWLLAGGDQFATTIDITPAGTGPEDITVPGTPDTGADSTGSDPSGNLTAAVNLMGGPGDDQLEPGNGDDNVNGGAGDDVAVYGDAGAGVNVDLDAPAPQSTGGSGNDTLTDMQSINGSRFNDTLLGSAINNRIGGCDGDDTIDGRSLNDSLSGDLPIAGAPIAPGLSTCAGPDGDDLITGGSGNDIVDGTGGDDVVNEEAAPTGADVLAGGSGNENEGGDCLDHSDRTGAVNVNINGLADDGEAGEGDNVAADFECYLGGAGNDTYSGSASSEVFTPGPGNDTVDGNGGTDYLDLSDAAGPAVFDLITSTATGNGTDAFSDVEGFIGTGANDTVLWDGTVPLLDFFGGGGPHDIVDASSALVPVAIDLSSLGTGRDVEDATGGAGDDVLLGNDVANRLIGNDGFDTIFAGSANDFVEGGLGNDILSGDAGGDTLSYVNSPDGMLIDNQLGFTQGLGGPGDGEDTISFFELVNGSDFGDEIIGGQTSLDANNRFKGRGGDDSLTGTNSSDTLLGGGGSDFIRAGNGDDNAKGGKGNDELNGSNGDDFLQGGKGNDTGNGGGGNDR